MATFEDDPTYKEGMKDVPPMARAAIDQLREITNAQTDFIAYLLVQLQRKDVLSDTEVHHMIERFQRCYGGRPGWDEHGPLAESIADMYGAQLLEL